MQTATATGDATPRTAKTDRPRSGKTNRPKSEKTVKTTIVMSRDLNFILGSFAEYREVDRSALAARLIQEGLKKDYPALFESLSGFKPERARKAKPDVSGALSESARDEPELNSDAESEG